MQKFFFISALLLSLTCPEAYAKDDLIICQSYEFHGQLSKQLEKEPILTAPAETGVEVDLVVEAKGDIALDLISLKGRAVAAQGTIKKKLSSRKYLFSLESINLDKPLGLGAGTGNLRAKRIKIKSTPECNRS